MARDDRLRDMLLDDRDEDESPLTGTDLQKRLFSDAIDEMQADPDMTVGEFVAKYDDYSQPYTDQVLRRADEEFAEEVGLRQAYSDVINGTEDAETSSGNGTEPTMHSLVGMAVYVPDRGYMVDIEVTERCPQCDEVHDVVYLVPLARSTYLQPPECGHKRVIGEIPDELREEINQRRTQLGRLNGSSVTDEREGES